MRLPFLTRQHLSANYPYDLFAVPLRDIVRIHTAPGTSSNPTVSGYTRQDLCQTEAHDQGQEDHQKFEQVHAINLV